MPRPTASEAPAGSAPTTGDRGTQPQPETHEQELKRVRRELADAQLMLMGKEAEFRNELKELRGRNAELLDRIVRLTQRDRELQARIVDAQFDGSGAKAEVKKLDEELRDLRRAYQRKEKELQTLTARVEELQRSGAEAEERLGECGEGLEQERAALHEVHARIRENLAAVADLTSERDRLRGRLVSAEGGMSALKEHLREALTRKARPSESDRPGDEGEAAPRKAAETRPQRPAAAMATAEEETSAGPSEKTLAAGSQDPARTATATIAAPSGYVSTATGHSIFATGSTRHRAAALSASERRAARSSLAIATLRSFEERGGIPLLPDPGFEASPPTRPPAKGEPASSSPRPGGSFDSNGGKAGDQARLGQRSRSDRGGRSRGPREPRSGAGGAGRAPQDGRSRGRSGRGSSRGRGPDR